MKDKSILLAYKIDTNGKCEPLEENHLLTEKIKSEELTWVHLSVDHPDTENWLKKEMDYLDPYILKALLAHETRPRMKQINDGILLTLRGVNLTPQGDPEDMISMRIWIDPHRIITAQRRPLKTISDMEDKLQEGSIKNSGQFLNSLISTLCENMEPTLSTLNYDADGVEDHILRYANPSLRDEIIDMRRKAIIFKRYLAPQKDALAGLLTTDLNWLKKEHKGPINESLNHTIRYIEDMDAVKERTQIINDELSNLIGDKINKNMYILSIISVIFLPITFLTGLFGTNIAGIPGANNGYAFGLFCAILLVIISIQIYILRKFKWF